MKEQILVFYSTLHDSGIILDITSGGELDLDVVEGGCYNTEDLLLDDPSFGDDWYGLWIWEGNIGLTSDQEIEYIGKWRRLTAEEIVLLVKGCRVIKDPPTDVEINKLVN